MPRTTLAAASFLLVSTIGAVAAYQHVTNPYRPPVTPIAVIRSAPPVNLPRAIPVQSSPTSTKPSLSPYIACVQKEVDRPGAYPYASYDGQSMPILMSNCHHTSDAYLSRCKYRNNENHAEECVLDVRIAAQLAIMRKDLSNNCARSPELYCPNSR